MAARTETRRNALLTVAAVLVGVVALNTVIDVLARSTRIDLTQDRLYSTSKGVDRTLGTLDQTRLSNSASVPHATLTWCLRASSYAVSVPSATRICLALFAGLAC